VEADYDRIARTDGVEHGGRNLIVQLEAIEPHALPGVEEIAQPIEALMCPDGGEGESRQGGSWGCVMLDA
jgi:hypothetical protein